MKQIKENKKLIIVCILIAAIAVFGLHKPIPDQSRPAGATQEASKSKPPVLTPTINLSSALAAARIPGKSLHIPVLMYHHVGPLPDRPDKLSLDLTVSPDEFRAQVEYFKNSGYETVTVEQAYRALEFGDKLPAKPIIFTFDDGYKDVFTYAVPILKDNGYVGTFAIATELLGRPTYAVWSDVLAAQKNGMEIVSHTENHLDLTDPIYSAEDLNREISGSKEVLEKKLGQPVEFFVYPYGKHNAKVEELIAQAGYKAAFTTEFGEYMSQDSLLRTPRVRVHGGAEGLDKLKRIFSPGWHSGSARLSP